MQSLNMQQLAELAYRIIIICGRQGQDGSINWSPITHKCTVGVATEEWCCVTHNCNYHFYCGWTWHSRGVWSSYIQLKHNIMLDIIMVSITHTKPYIHTEETIVISFHSYIWHCLSYCEKTNLSRTTTTTTTTTTHTKHTHTHTHNCMYMHTHTDTHI